jgi:hypothetical protein
MGSIVQLSLGQQACVGLLFVASSPRFPIRRHGHVAKRREALFEHRNTFSMSIPKTNLSSKDETTRELFENLIMSLRVPFLQDIDTNHKESLTKDMLIFCENRVHEIEM